MSRKHLKPGALTAPLPPVLVTVGEGDAANIITIGWTGILATHPARTYISVRPERYSYGLLKRHGEFVINLATVDMARHVDYCGIYTGAKVDKFKECNLTPTESREVSIPSIAECPLSIECCVVEVIPMGTHDVFIADIVGVSCDESILDESGRLCFERAGLLAYAHGEYFALGEKVGKFGFSTDKKNGKKRGVNPPSTEKKPTRSEGEKGKGASGRSAMSKKGASHGSSHPADSKGASHGSSHPADSKGASHGKGQTTDSNSKHEGHRPFYLDAPRGKGRTQGKKKAGKK